MAETLTIDHVGHRGDGVAATAAGMRYVPFTLPGEIVEADGATGREAAQRILKPSPQRIPPFCPHFGTCGGCAIQHWEHSAYLAWKRDLVSAALRQANIAAQIAPIVDAHGAGRRRITLHARRSGDGMKVGFAAAQSHAVVPIDACPILDPALEGAFEAAQAIANALASTNKPLDIQVTAAREGLDVDVRGSGALETRLVGRLATLAQAHRLARLTRHGELIVQRAAPTIAVGRASVALPPGSFLQATAAGEEALAAQVLALIGKPKHVADLFCGVGPFALRLAERAKIAAFDSEAAAIAALTKAAQTPGLKPIVAATRDLFRRPLLPHELEAFDAVAFDPPRQGAEAQATQLAKSRVKTIIAVSCNAGTFARDAAILIGGGYTLGPVTPIDQFRHTPHVEIVAAFRR